LAQIKKLEIKNVRIKLKFGYRQRYYWWL